MPIPRYRERSHTLQLYPAPLLARGLGVFYDGFSRLRSAAQSRQVEERWNMQMFTVGPTM